MASLMEELLGVLREEKNSYEDLLALTDSKRDAIVHNKLDILEQVTEKEESISSVLKNLEKKRLRVLKDMAVVLGHDGEELTVTQMIELLDKQPEEQKKTGVFFGCV